MSVLIIEPSRELAGVLTEALKRAGMPCRTARTAQEGIKLADKKAPGLVIIELLMPRHNGIEFIHEFRSYPDWLDIPILLYTNISRDELQMSDEILAEMGIAGHFYKPTASLESVIGAVESNFALKHI